MSGSCVAFGPDCSEFCTLVIPAICRSSSETNPRERKNPVMPARTCGLEEIWL